MGQAVSKRGQLCADRGAALDARTIAGAKARSVGNRLGEIDDVVPLIGVLCRPENAWITAQTIRANGGMA